MIKESQIWGSHWQVFLPGLEQISARNDEIEGLSLFPWSSVDGTTVICTATHLSVPLGAANGPSSSTSPLDCNNQWPRIHQMRPYHKQVPMPWISNHIPQYSSDAITYPCLRYLLLVRKSNVCFILFGDFAVLTLSVLRVCDAFTNIC